MTSDASDNCWIPIRYRGFYDVPLAIHVRWDDVDLLLDCPFDEALDEYSPEYRILHVRHHRRAKAPGGRASTRVSRSAAFPSRG